MSGSKGGRSGLISHGTVAQNRRARHEYTIEDTIEAGIMLVGTEVKSLRHGRGTINEAYAGPDGDDLVLFNAYIPEYQTKGAFSHEPRRPRKLLLHRREIHRLAGAVSREGATIVPLALYFNSRGIAKVQLGLAVGKKKADKREAERERDWNRQKARLMREKG